MKITKLLGALALSLALVIVAGCPGGQLQFDGQAGAGIGETIELGSGDDGATLASQPADPICTPNALLPAGMDAYVQLRLNDIFDNRIPFVYNLMRDEIYDDEFGDLLVYDNYSFGGERGNIWAIFRSVFDEKLREAAGVGLGDMDCIALAIQTPGDFCQSVDRPCFNTWDVVQANLTNLPFIGQYLAQVMTMFPKQFRDLFGIFQIVKMPDPSVLFQELNSEDIEIMVAMNWEPGSLAKFKDFMEWFQAAMAEPPPDFDQNLPPEFSLIKAPQQQPVITWGAIEDYEGCFTATLGTNPNINPGVVLPGDSSSLTLWTCEMGDYLLLANSESGMNELLGRYELMQQNIVAGSFLDDPAYKQTYKALWRPDMGIAPPNILMAAKLHQLQDNLLGLINARTKPKMDTGLGPMIDQYLPMLSEDAQVAIAGLGLTLDASSDVRMTLQLRDTASLDSPIFTLGKQVSVGGEIEGYYDSRVRFGFDMSSPMIDSIDMGYYMSPDQLGTPVDGYNLVAMMLIQIEQLIDTYIGSLAQ